MDAGSSQFQNSNGPNAAPKPAHAKDTIVKIELSGFCAIKTAIREMTMTVILAMRRDALVSSFFLPKSCTRFWEMLEAAARSWESAVDMVAAKIPARITPAINAGMTPCVLGADAC